MKPVEEARRQRFFKKLLKAVYEKEPTHGTFAACGAVKPSQGFSLRSFHIEGVGELQLPLSTEDSSKLHRVCEQAPFGKGSVTVVDTNVRRCWQVDSSKVTFPGAPSFLSHVVQPLAVNAVRALGLNGPGVQLEAHFYKLLFYEAGGHFTFHRDTEKEEGMFASLILQFPTEEGYTGGKLVVKHYNQVKEFDCSLASSLGFCYTVFFADCLHELQKIESGTRLCLAFTLVRHNSSVDPFHSGFMAHKLPKVEAALEPWLKEVTETELNVFGEKLAIPLQHKYTEKNLSFARLKGDDIIVAAVLKECRDKNKERWLDLYLCLVTKYQKGMASNQDPLSMEDLMDEDIRFENWMGLDDRPVSAAVTDLDIDMDMEVVCVDEEPFDEEPDDKEYEEHHGNYGPTLEYWYHTAMLVAQPKPRPEVLSILNPERSRLELGNSRSSIPETKTVPVTRVQSGSGQCGNKRLEPEVIEDTKKKTQRSTTTCIDLSDALPGQRGSKRQMPDMGVTEDTTKSGTIQIIDLSDDE